MLGIRYKGRGERERDDDKGRAAPVIGVIALVLAVAAYVAFVPQEKAATPSDAGHVAATVFPLFDIARNVAGDVVEVELLLPSGASPHTFEPSPSSLATLDRASAVYAIGHGLDDWVDPLLADVASSKVIVDPRIGLRESEEHDGGAEETDGHGHSQGQVDPHYWLDARNAMIIATTIAEDLSVRYPAHAAAFNANLDRYLSSLRTLHAEITAQLSGVEPKKIVTLHDGWGYFAAAYGFEVVGTFEPSPGREPTPKYLADLSTALKEAGTDRLFTEPQIATGSLSSFLEDNGLSLAMLDPLGGGPARESYVSMMRYNAGVIAGE